MNAYIIKQDDIRIDKQVKKIIPGCNQAIIERFLRKKLITLNDKKVKSSAKAKMGDILNIPSSLKAIISSRENKEEKTNNTTAKERAIIRQIGDSVIYEDENILAINKPFDLPVQSGKNVAYSIDKLIKKIPDYKELRVVHRLDKHTTGVLLFAKNINSTKELMGLFKNSQIKKEYIAILVGKLSEEDGQIKSYLKKAIVSGEEVICSNESEGELAITNFKLVKQNNFASLVNLYPITGKKHQLRVHMNSIGHPVLSDGKYGRKKAFIEDCKKMMCLHAYSINFTLFEKEISIKAEIPKHIKYNLEKLALINESL